MTKRRTQTRHRAASSGATALGQAQSWQGIWHRPAVLFLISDLLTLFATVALGYAFALWFLNQPIFPLREVLVLSPIKQIGSEQIEYAARKALKGNFLTLRLDEARLMFEELPWVRRVELRRRWPNKIELHLEEQQAVAYWLTEGSGEVSLVNRFGEVFVGNSDEVMPQLSGPPGSAPYMLEKHRHFSDLLAPLQRSLAGLWLSARKAWQLRLDNGMVLLLGRDQNRAPVDQRLLRFVEAWPSVSGRLTFPVEIADLRYQSGFSLTPVAEIKAQKGKE